MAETKGNETKAGDTKSGAVKPPVLDLKAREAADASKPEAKPASAKPEAKPAPAFTPKPAESVKPAAAQSSGFAFGAALTGGVIGLAAAYGLAWFGLWPSAPAPAPAADPRVTQFATAIPELETVTQTTQSELATLTQRVGALESSPADGAAPAAAPEVATLEADIAALAQRIDALPAAAPPADTGAISTDIAALATRLDELAARVGTAEAGLRTLDTTVSQTSAALAEQPSDIGAVLQLPLILSGFETAFATGRPYEAELGALRAAVPNAAIPTPIANAAATGLPRPDTIAQRFAAVLPAIIAGRPADPDAQWQDGALDWFRSAIALRPTGELEGDNPEAVVSRLEGAIARRDFATAESLIATLPEPMRLAAEDVPDMVSTQAEATRFLDTLRAEALSGEAAQ